MVCTTNIEPFDEHNDKWIKIYVAFVFLRRNERAKFPCLAYLWNGQVSMPSLSLDSLILHFFLTLISKNSSHIYSIKCHYLKVNHLVNWYSLNFLLYLIWNNNVSCKNNNNNLVVNVPCLYTLVHKFQIH